MTEKTTPEDEIEASRMPLIDHLIELRQRLIWAIGAILAGKIFAMPHASKAGVVGVAVVILAAVAYQIFPAIVAAIVGTGCVG